jgi:hypothetical protein
LARHRPNQRGILAQPHSMSQSVLRTKSYAQRFRPRQRTRVIECQHPSQTRSTKTVQAAFNFVIQST